MRLRDPILVAIFNLIPGGCWGYFALGQIGKGIVALLLNAPLFLITWGTGNVAMWIVAAIDAFLQAKQLDAGRVIGKWTFFKQSKPLAAP